MKLRLIVGGRTRRRLPSRTWRQAFIERYGFRVVPREQAAGCDHDGALVEVPELREVVCTRCGEMAPTVEKHLR